MQHIAECSIPAPAEPGTLILDTAADMTPRLVRAIRAARIAPRPGLDPRPVRGVILYLRYDDRVSRWDWDREEMHMVLSEGLMAGFVQRCRSRLTPSLQLGRRSGEEAVENLQELYAPAGAQAWVDVEGEIQGTPAAEIAYDEAWAEAVTGAAYLAGLYVGMGSRLTGQQIGALRGITAYWDSLSDVRRQTPQPRQWCMEQVRQVNVAGTQFDLNITGQDKRGGRPVFLCLPEAMPA